MAGIAGPNEIIPENTTSRIATLSPQARHLLEIIIKTWLNDTEPGQTLLRGMSSEAAQIAVMQLLDHGAMVIKMAAPPPGAPLGALSLTLTDYGHAVGRGQVQ